MLLDDIYPDTYRERGLSNYKLFIEAVLMNLPGVVECMLQHGADPNAYGSLKQYQMQGEPPILSAVSRHS